MSLRMAVSCSAQLLNGFCCLLCCARLFFTCIRHVWRRL